MKSPPDIKMIPIDAIAVVNPRDRNKKIFNELVVSIERLGLKKPITVSKSKNGEGYDLVCGQGRLEAFKLLNQLEIPAVLLDVSQDDGLVMGLVENLARRHHTPMELIGEIGALKRRGYSHGQIAEKIGFSAEYITSICYLLDHGEERLLIAIEKGQMPHTIAMEISRAKESDVQRALADAYEAGSIPGNQVLTIRRIVEQRNLTGKAVHSIGARGRSTARSVTAKALISSYRREADRQKLIIKKAGLAQTRLLFLVNALRRLLADKDFASLLKQEALATMPTFLADRIEPVVA